MRKRPGLQRKRRLLYVAGLLGAVAVGVITGRLAEQEAPLPQHFLEAPTQVAPPPRAVAPAQPAEPVAQVETIAPMETLPEPAAPPEKLHDPVVEAAKIRESIQKAISGEGRAPASSDAASLSRAIAAVEIQPRDAAVAARFGSGKEADSLKQLFIASLYLGEPAQARGAYQDTVAKFRQDPGTSVIAIQAAIAALGEGNEYVYQREALQQMLKDVRAAR